MGMHLFLPMYGCNGHSALPRSHFSSRQTAWLSWRRCQITFRIVATLDNAPEKPRIADIQALLDARETTNGENRVEQVVWSSRFRVHHRVAKSYSEGKFLLMGDAAHVHSPAGGRV